MRLRILFPDSLHVRLLRRDDNNVPRIANDFDSATARLMAYDLVSAGPGPAFENARPGSHGIVPQYDPHQIKKAFAHCVARQLCHAAASDAFGRLVLGTPARVLNRIEAARDEPTAPKAVPGLAKHLVKVPSYTLSRHLHQWVAAPHRVM